MTLTVDSTDNLEKVIADGMHTLLDEVEAIRNRNNYPLLLAVSRRVPHVIFWYKYTQASEKEREALDKLEIITEIALPFLQYHDQKENLEILIIDDIVFSGKTLNYIIDLTRDITGIQCPKAFVFFYYDDFENILEWAEENKVTATYKYSDTEHKAIREFISTIIAVTLPIDVSYPLFYMEGKEAPIDFKAFGTSAFKDEKAIEIDNYQLKITYKTDLSTGPVQKVKKGDSQVSYTSLLPSELSNSLNNDFAKIRVYDRLGETVIMSYAPNILADSVLRDINLFECKEYREIWNIVLASVSENLFESVSPFDNNAIVKERRSNRTSRSLVSVANYLYSISSFNRVLREDTSPKTYNYVIKEKDLTLIIGKELAEKIIPLLQNIITNRLVSPKTHKKVTVESVFIPEDYYTEYTVSKYTIIDDEIDTDDEIDQLDSNLKAIFNNARQKSTELPALTIEEMEYEVEGIMESFESIEKALMVKDYERKVEINKWVDRKIDEGELVSRYAYTYDFSGNKYWRRFFRKTSLEQSNHPLP